MTLQAMGLQHAEGDSREVCLFRYPLLLFLLLMLMLLLLLLLLLMLLLLLLLLLVVRGHRGDEMRKEK